MKNDQNPLKSEWNDRLCRNLRHSNLHMMHKTCSPLLKPDDVRGVPTDFFKNHNKTKKTYLTDHVTRRDYFSSLTYFNHFRGHGSRWNRLISCIRHSTLRFKQRHLIKIKKIGHCRSRMWRVQNFLPPAEWGGQSIRLVIPIIGWFCRYF